MYNMKPSLTFWPVEKPQCKKSRLTVEAVGLASKGSLQVCYIRLHSHKADDHHHTSLRHRLKNASSGRHLLYTNI